MINDSLGKLSPSMARSPLLLIDDNLANLDLLERILEWAGFLNVRSCTNAMAGLEALASWNPHLVILDLKMPGMTGFEFFRQVREEMPHHSFLPILVYTADLTPEAKIQALQLGASDFLTKPGDSVEIQLRLRNFLRTRQLQNQLQNHNEILEAQVQLRTNELAVSRRESVELLATVSEYRDDDTGQHVRRVGELAVHIAHHIPGLDDEFLRSLKFAAPLHDIGKIGIPDHILRKPGSLTMEETCIMRRHVSIGAAILEHMTSPILQVAREIAACHHERWDGTGYPEGLRGEAIPLSARIVSVADTFDAMTNDRPYRKGLSELDARAEIRRLSGAQFDPTVVAALESYVATTFERNLEAA
jgi:putative two-component system response regulator